MRLAYFSPFNPQKSGIADYSEELLPHLAEGAEIDLFVEGFEPEGRELKERFRLFDYITDPSALSRLPSYDAVLYHLGNDHRYHAGIFDTARQHPGIIVFHDYALHNFFIGLARERRDMHLYLEEVEACHGAQACAEAEEAVGRGALPWFAERPLDFPLNARLARDAEAIIVHSEWSRERFAKIAPATPVARVKHHITERAAATEPAPRRSESRPVRISSFGLITPDKGIERALRALSALRDSHDFHYTLVGEPNRFFDVRALVEDYGLRDRVTITGYVSLEEFQRAMSETDIAINLRERTSGETSGSLCRIMASAVPAIVSNVGWFAELPDNAVVKIDMDEYADALLYAYLERLIEDAPLRAALGANARRYVLAEHDIKQSAAGYLSFIAEVVERRARRRFVAGVSKEAARLGVMPDDERLLRGLAVEVAALAPAHSPNGDHHHAAEHQNAMNTSSQDRNGTDAFSPNQESADAAPQNQNGTGDASRNDAREDALSQTANDASAAPASTAAPSLNAAPASTATPSENATPPVDAAPSVVTSGSAASGGRLPKIEGIDYKRAAVEYPRKLDAERRHYLLTKPFYNLANKPPKHTGWGMDAETHRHFCDFANMAVALALPAGSRLLDVGCGSGWLSEYFARLGYDVTGIDISPDLIEMARQRLERITYDVDHQTPLRYRFMAHDIETAPLAETFDAVICYDSLHHFVDERAVVRHLAEMVAVGGMLFVLEGDRPPEGSETEKELVGVMEEYETLESPFSPEYLRALLGEHGFAIVGDFVSINGLFDRDMLKTADATIEGAVAGQTYLPVWHEQVNYLLCKKVSEGATPASMPDSRAPGRLQVRLTLLNSWPRVVAAGSVLQAHIEIENTGDTLWLTGPAIRRGAVMPGVKLLDAAGGVLRERHGAPPLPRALAPGERVRLVVEEQAPETRGRYQLKIDMVAQHVAWFEHQGSEPLVLPFEVS